MVPEKENKHYFEVQEGDHVTFSTIPSSFFFWKPQTSRSDDWLDQLTLAITGKEIPKGWEVLINDNQRSIGKKSYERLLVFALLRVKDAHMLDDGGWLRLHPTDDIFRKHPCDAKDIKRLNESLGFRNASIFQNKYRLRLFPSNIFIDYLQCKRNHLLEDLIEKFGFA